MNHRRATIVDVAREAGVSTATVSRSLREDPRVRPDTRERVREAAEKLRFVPNAQAAGLASGESRTVGLLAPLLTTWYTSEVVAGVEEALSLARYDLLLGTADPLATERVYRGAEGIRQRTDGMILVDALCQEDGARRLLEQGIAAVALGEELASISSITIDNVAGGKLAAEHLVARGKSQLAVIAGVVESPETSVLGGRLAGFGSGVRDAAMSEPLLEMDALSIEGGGARWRGCSPVTAPSTRSSLSVMRWLSELSPRSVKAVLSPDAMWPWSASTTTLRRRLSGSPLCANPCARWGPWRLTS